MDIHNLLDKLDLHQIEQLKLAKQAVTYLEGRKTTLLAEVAEVEDQIAAVKSGNLEPRKVLPSGGDGRQKGTPQPDQRKRAGGLADHVRQALAGATAPMSVQEVAEAVQAQGYQSKSKDFIKGLRVTMYQMKDVDVVERGQYRLKTDPAEPTL
jgi:hypothetical protein